MSGKSKNFFSDVEARFPVVSDNNIILSDPFLNAAKELLPFIDLLGTAFKPVKKDIEGNIMKLEKIYTSDCDKLYSLNAMLRSDIEQNNTKDPASATISLLWLKRALQFILVFLQQIVEDQAQGSPSENLMPFCQKAYEETLRKYHSWLVQKVFSIVSRAAPNRKKFLRTLAYGREGCDEEVIKDMDIFLQELSFNVEAVQYLYEDLGLDFQDKV